MNSTHVAASPSLVSAVVTVQPSSSLSTPVLGVSAIVPVASCAPSCLLSSSPVGPSPAPELPLHGDTISEDFQCLMNLIPKQRTVATLVVSSLVVGLESAQNDLTVAADIVFERS